jgi:hypothetical protein
MAAIKSLKKEAVRNSTRSTKGVRNQNTTVKSFGVVYKIETKKKGKKSFIKRAVSYLKNLFKL